MERATEAITTITLRDGKEYDLTYPMRTLKAIKKELGISLLQGTGFGGIDEDRLPALLHYGIRENHPDVTLEHVEDYLNGSDVLYAMRCIVLAATGRDVEAKDEKNADAAGEKAKTILAA